MIKGALLGILILLIAGLITAGAYYFLGAVFAAVATAVVVCFALIGKQEGW